jgi:hypothetical protein
MKSRLRSILGAAVFSGIIVTWSPFQSHLYPYTVSQPSSYRHIVLQDAAGHGVDYFFPSLGSFTTNVNIWAEPGHSVSNDGVYLRSMGAKNIQRSGWMKIVGQRRPIMRGDFKGIAGRWTVEQVTFSAAGLVWHLTASYDPKFKKVRPTLLRILSSFKLHTAIHASGHS